MYHRLFVLCLSLILLSACKSQASKLVPVTGEMKISAPAQVELARNHVLSYLVSSARLANLPRNADWQVEISPRSENEYHFRNGDWVIMIWMADSNDGRQQIVILNNVEDDAWTGYVTVDGEVVDTYYAR